MQKAEKEKQSERDRVEGSADVTGNKRSTGSAVDNTESETETESFSRKRKPASAPGPVSKSTSSALHPGDQDTRKRSSMSGDSSGYGSTDSEWEKVDGSNASDRNA